MPATTEFCNSRPSQTAWKQIKFFFFYRENLLLVQVWQNKPAGHFFLSLPDQDMKKIPEFFFFENVKRASRLVQSFNAATMKYILLPFDLQCKEKGFKYFSEKLRIKISKFNGCADSLLSLFPSRIFVFLLIYFHHSFCISVSFSLPSFFLFWFSLSFCFSLSFLQSHNCAFLIF